jgi:hypothetical protein
MPAYSPMHPGIYASNYVMQIGMHLQMHLHIKIKKKFYVHPDLNQSNTLTDCENGETIMKETIADFPAL